MTIPEDSNIGNRTRRKRNGEIIGVNKQTYCAPSARYLSIERRTIQSKELNQKKRLRKCQCHCIARSPLLWTIRVSLTADSRM